MNVVDPALYSGLAIGLRQPAKYILTDYTQIAGYGMFRRWCRIYGLRKCRRHAEESDGDSYSFHLQLPKKNAGTSLPAEGSLFSAVIIQARYLTGIPASWRWASASWRASLAALANWSRRERQCAAIAGRSNLGRPA